MKTTISYQVQLNFNQIVQIVKQLPVNDKIKLSKELEKDAINSKLTSLLKSFKTNELTEEMINQECEIVREKLYLNNDLLDLVEYKGTKIIKAIEFEKLL